MTESVFAVLDENNMVVNTIVADPNFTTDILEMVKDPKTDTGEYTSKNKFIDVTALKVRPATGWKRTGVDVYVAPEPTQEELDRQEDMRIRSEENVRVAELRKKVGPGKPGLSQAERDELNLIALSRKITTF